MGGNNGPPGHSSSNSVTTVAEALEIARDSEDGAQDPTVRNLLETAIAEIWARIEARPTSYVMNREEFAVFNYYQNRFEGLQGISTKYDRRGDSKMEIGEDHKPLSSVEDGHIYNEKSSFGRPDSIGFEPRRTSKLIWNRSLLLSFAACCIGLLWIFSDCLVASHGGHHEATSTSLDLARNAARTPAATPSSAVLECFQVYQPVLFPSGAVDETVMSDGSENTTAIAPTTTASSCEVLLMEHSFGLSYGKPFVGNYTPPDCKFNRVVMNFTVTSQGRQFDRLALMYFGDTEVWRTSTAEPTANGIRWEYMKDMTEYMYFWNSTQKLIFDLGNLIDSTYTGPFNTTLTATFFTAQESVEPASLIIPISARKGDAGAASVFTLPSDNATNTVSFPRNANRAVFSVSACGQAAEEFWWSNVLQSNVDTFVPVDGTLYGYSPFREVQVLIDGQLAGVQWPFPVIFTGGVVPGLWRPIVGIDAFDLREHEIDITPWLPVLSDGNEHTFEIRVVGLLDDGKNSGTLSESVGSSWYVTGKIFLWQDDANAITTGPNPTLLLPAPTIAISQSLTQNSTGANETLTYTTNVSRSLTISSLLTTQNGTSLVTWTQSLAVTNYGLYTAFGAIQVNNQTTTGTDLSTGGTFYKAAYFYPLWVNSAYIVQPSGNFTLDASVIRGMDLSIQGSPVFPTGLQPFSSPSISLPAPLSSNLTGSSLTTTQNGTAHYFGSPSAGTSSGFGSTGQEFWFRGVGVDGGAGDAELYYRSVEAVNATVVRDVERLVGVELEGGGYAGPVEGVLLESQVVTGVVSPKEVIGRGPGKPRALLVQSGGGQN
ncbi:Peptide-N4-(N-acetyl-beta-glucosaminyl)asparagine amidase A [Lachnellula occidentalis]|uniref:Peptide-N4-(N-acetyl-beta-glucosaminyl)asparagine amidase A n=1 Tax=Lachnellula occidentalis TaxID=215460 RepID=A0A8H8UIA8_9HELO|nr:Peptide-N4-(N-acetyl-beta-glucosaminyl)asparagine amidase A [Lachnellula occidentalis]